jgi:4-hydroxybenzoate polyprenyltransferase
MEYVPLQAPGVFVPLFFAATSFQSLLSLHVVEALVIFTLLFFSGFIINALADVEVDTKYKTYVSDAVRVLGEKKLKIFIVIHVALALLLTLHLSFVFNNYWLILWVSVATFFGLAYSVKPFHFKVRGLLQFSLMIFSIIMVSFIYYIINGTPSIPALFVFLSFLIVTHGIELVNQTQDYIDDKESGLLTPAVRWGITPTLIASLIIALIGIIFGIIGFYYLYMDLPNLIIFGNVVGFEFLLIISIIILIFTYYVPLIGTWRFIKISKQNITNVDKILFIKKNLNYPIWQFTGIFGVTFIATLFFIWKII